MLLTVAGLAALAPAGASAACPLYVPHGAAEHPLALADGTRLVARDPYGGLLARNRLFFDFSVQKAAGGSPTGIAQATWALDGKVVRTDAKAPYEWKGLSSSDRRMPAGDHKITVAVTPSGGGAPVSTTFALTATDCQPAFANVFFERKTVTLDAASAFEGGDGPPMRGVDFLGRGLVARIPAATRGRVAGKLTVDGRSTYTLRIPRRGSTLLSRGPFRVVLHPGAKRFLTIRGLIGGTVEANLRLTGAGAKLIAIKRPRVRCEYSSAAIIRGNSKNVRVEGYLSSGRCPRP